MPRSRSRHSLGLLVNQLVARLRAEPPDLATEALAIALVVLTLERPDPVSKIEYITRHVVEYVRSEMEERRRAKAAAERLE